MNRLDRALFRSVLVSIFMLSAGTAFAQGAGAQSGTTPIGEPFNITAFQTQRQILNGRATSVQTGIVEARRPDIPDAKPAAVSFQYPRVQGGSPPQVGQVVYVSEDRKRVSIDGVRFCCDVIQSSTTVTAPGQYVWDIGTQIAN